MKEIDYPAYFRNAADYYKRKKLKSDLNLAADRIEQLEKIIVTYIKPYDCELETSIVVKPLHARYRG